MATSLATKELQHFHISKAYYCLDCEHVSNDGSICISCGCAGSNLMPLSPILNRAEEEKYVRA